MYTQKRRFASLCALALRSAGLTVLGASLAAFSAAADGSPQTPPPPTATPPAAAAPEPATPAAPPPAASPAAPTDVPAPAPAAEAAPGAPADTGVAPAEATAFAYFYRKKTILGGALNTSVHVDGVEVADLDPGTYVKVPLEAGTHAFYSDEKDDTLKLEIEAGKEYYFRIELKAGMWKGHGVLNRLDPAEGSPEFEKWKLKLAEDVRKPEMVVKDPRKP